MDIFRTTTTTIAPRFGSTKIIKIFFFVCVCVKVHDNVATETTYFVKLYKRCGIQRSDKQVQRKI